MKTAQGTLLVSNGQVVDGNGGPPIRDGAVVAKDGKIVYVGPAAGAPEIPQGALMVDAKEGRSR